MFRILVHVKIVAPTPSLAPGRSLARRHRVTPDQAIKTFFGSNALVAIVVLALITIFLHLYQAANALLNWTMMQPYRWTGLGYEHAAFMWAQIGLVLFFWGQVAIVAKENPRAILSHRILIVALCGLAFLRLVFTDYGYF